MSNKSKEKTNITRISATPHRPETETKATPAPTAETHPVSTDKKAKKAKTGRKIKGYAPGKPLKEVFLLARPFVALGRYLRDSWRELRQVRWPNRKATWKMTLAVLIYCAIFIVFIVLLDTFFTFIFKTLLGNN